MEIFRSEEGNGQQALGNSRIVIFPDLRLLHGCLLPIAYCLSSANV
jgi:hypothetical protein